MPRIKFSEWESTVHKAVVVSFDLEGFSQFCNQPDASVAAPRLMKHTFDLLNRYLRDQDDDEPKKLVEPSFIKFSGDGALLIWILQPQLKDFPQEFCDLLVSIMRSFQQQLTIQLLSWEKDWRVNNLPKHARFGIATGIVYAMRPPHAIRILTDPNDFVGYCINLAVRLQDYCPSLGFLIHGVLHPKLEGMEHLVATKIKGGQRETVAMFTKDIDRVNMREFQSKFVPSAIN